MSALVTLGSVKEISRTRRCLWCSSLLSVLALPLTNNWLLVGTLETIPPLFALCKDQPMSEDYRGQGVRSVSAIDVIEAPSGVCWLQPPIFCLLPPTAEASKCLCCFQFRPYWCLKRSCASCFTHLLKGLTKYKFINGAMKRLNPSLIGFQKFQQESKYTWCKSGKQNIFFSELRTKHGGLVHARQMLYHWVVSQQWKNTWKQECFLKG